jgi:hypothetical protein
VLGAARGTTNYLLLSANLRRPTGPCHVTPIRPQAHQRVARNDPKESQKVAPRLISRGRGAALGKLLSQSGGTQRMRPVLRTAFDPLQPLTSGSFGAVNFRALSINVYPPSLIPDTASAPLRSIS